MLPASPEGNGTVWEARLRFFVSRRHGEGYAESGLSLVQECFSEEIIMVANQELFGMPLARVNLLLSSDLNKPHFVRIALLFSVRGTNRGQNRRLPLASCQSGSVWAWPLETAATILDSELSNSLVELDYNLPTRTFRHVGLSRRLREIAFSSAVEINALTWSM